MYFFSETSALYFFAGFFSVRSPYTMFGIENEKNNKEQMRTPETDMTQEVI